MDLSLVNTETVDLLCRITGRKLQKEDLTPVVVFLAALITVLLGVIFADTAVAYREEQRLQRILDSFVPIDENVRQLTQLMIGGIDWHHVYINPHDWMTLTAPLSASERLLLISLGYEMSTVDGNMDSREKTYLQEVAYRLELPPSHITTLEHSFSGEATPDADALAEVKAMLHASNFATLDEAFTNISRDVLYQL